MRGEATSSWARGAPLTLSHSLPPQPAASPLAADASIEQPGSKWLADRGVQGWEEVGHGTPAPRLELWPAPGMAQGSRRVQSPAQALGEHISYRGMAPGMLDMFLLPVVACVKDCELLPACSRATPRCKSSLHQCSITHSCQVGCCATGFQSVTLCFCIPRGPWVNWQLAACENQGPRTRVQSTRQTT